MSCSSGSESRLTRAGREARKAVVRDQMQEEQQWRTEAEAEERL